MATLGGHELTTYLQYIVFPLVGIALFIDYHMAIRYKREYVLLIALESDGKKRIFN